MLKNVPFIVLILIGYSSYSQIISGVIFDNKTKEPLPGASIYLDGTTLGTTSDMDGNFELDTKSSQNATLVISFVGYETQLLSLSNFKNIKNVYLKEGSNQLREVKLGLDIWSRSKKMRIFKTEFLGKTPASSQCNIINEKDIILVYNSEENTLTAYADVPIIVKNKYLGYELSYVIVDFEIQFGTDLQGFRYTNKVYYAGTTFFKELKKKTKKKIITNREKEFHGSLVHFMRSLASSQLVENKFQIFFERQQTYPYKYFEITYENNQTKVVLNAPKLDILYNNIDQSSMQPEVKNQNEFYIDKDGNHSPPTNMLFGGIFGIKRISNMLPINYEPNENFNE